MKNGYVEIMPLSFGGGHGSVQVREELLGPQPIELKLQTPQAHVAVWLDPRAARMTAQMLNEAADRWDPR